MLIPKLNRVFLCTCNGKYSKKDIKRFISYIKINKQTQCWEWTIYLNDAGYGIFGSSKNNKHTTRKAHRVSWEIFYNNSLYKEIHICHKCDNPKCVNPHHLFKGTPMDNMKDKVNKDRQSKGENSGHSILNWEKINKIRKLYSTNLYTYEQLAKLFLSSRNNIFSIIQNKTWYDINYLPPQKKIQCHIAH
jgi:hypothetical protein